MHINPLKIEKWQMHINPLNGGSIIFLDILLTLDKAPYATVTYGMVSEEICR